MLYIFGYVVTWIVSSVVFNRLLAIEEGESSASEMLPLLVTFAFMWPFTLPFVIVYIAVSMIVKILKGELK